MKKQMLWQIMMPCLIAILMLVLMMPIYYFSYQNARQMAVDHASSRIQTGISNLSTLISMHNTNLYELSTSKEVRSFMKKSLTRQQQGINAYHYMADSDRLHITNDLIKDVLMVVSGGEVVLGMDFVSCTPERDYGCSFYIEGMDYDKFCNLLSTAQKYLPAKHYVSYYRCSEPCIVYQWRNFDTSPGLSVSSFLSIETMKQELGFYDIDDAYLCLSIPAESLTLYQSHEKVNDGQGYIMVTMEDARLGMQVAFGIPSAYISRQMQPVLMTICGYALLAFSIAMIISMVHMVRSYQHVSPLLDYLAHSNNDNSKENVYAQLYRALQRSDQQGEAIRAQYNEVLQERRSLAIDKLLHRLPLEEENWQSLQEIDVFDQSWVAIQMELKKPQEADGHAVVLSIFIKSILQNVWPKGYIHASEGNRFLCLVSASESGPQYTEKAVQEIVQQTGTEVYAGISLPHEDVLQLPAACDAALRAAFTAHRNQPLYYSAEMRRFGEISLFGLCRELSERISAGNEERVSELFDQLRDQLGKGNGWQPSQVIHILNSMLEYTLAGTANEAENLPVANRPWRDAFEDLQRAAMQHCWQIQKRKNQQKSEKADEIVGYINEHYADPQICLTQIAEQFQVTETYISWYIKANTGRNYTAHIEELRMQKAMELLKEESIPISEIAQRIGYERINTFYKSFRRYWGSAPGSFRKEK